MVAESQVCLVLDISYAPAASPLSRTNAQLLEEFATASRHCSKCDRLRHSLTLIITSVRQNGAGRIVMMNCPRCTSVRIHQSRRRGIIETVVLAVICFRPFRCERCDARFFRFSLTAKTNSPGHAAMY